MRDLFKVAEYENGLKLNCVWNGATCHITLTNTKKQEITLNEIKLFEAEMMYSEDTEFYGEGFNMLSQYGGKINDFKLIGSYSDYDHYRLKRPEGINQVYNVLMLFPKGKDALLIGFASCNRFNGLIRFNRERIEILLDGENIKIGAGETIELEEVFIDTGKRNQLLNSFGDAINKNHPRLPFDEIPTGWCSWLVYGPNITAKNIYDNLNAIKENNLDLKYIQIDDGYQAYWGDWFDFTDKFEGGVKKVCLDIKEKCFEPAIWVAPFVAERESKLFKEHPSWFVKDDNGEPLASDKVTFGGWRCAPWYILDMTNPEARDYIKKVFSTMNKEWGVTYFKLDAIVWEALPFGHRYDNTKTSVEAFKMGMDAIIESAGEGSFILGGNSPMWPSIGKVNGMRVTNDNQRYFDQFKQIAIECFYRNWQHNKLWINDPDTVLLQNQSVKIIGPDGSEIFRDGTTRDEEFRFNAAYTLASGGMVLSGDDVSSLTKENIELQRRLLPPTEYAAEFDDTTFTVGRAKIDCKTEIVYIFNFDDCEKSITVNFDGKVEIYDIILDRSYGVIDNQIIFKDFKPHDGRALLCKKIK